jgi:Papain-like cysteine protease AvrRpt2
VPDIYLSVPFVTQLDFGDPTHPIRDYTGCWYASVCMVNYYFEQGPRYGMPEMFNKSKQLKNAKGEIYTNNYHSALPLNRFVELAANENLQLVDLPASKAFTSVALFDLLNTYGPLTMCWKKTSASTGKVYGHCSTVVGLKEGPDRLIFHDPEKAPNSELTLDDFNAKLIWTPGTIMHRKK